MFLPSRAIPSPVCVEMDSISHQWIWAGGEALPKPALIYKRNPLAFKLVLEVCGQRSLPGLDGAAGLRLWGGGKLKSLLLRLTSEGQQGKMKAVTCVGFIYL